MLTLTVVKKFQNDSLNLLMFSHWINKRTKRKTNINNPQGKEMYDGALKQDRRDGSTAVPDVIEIEHVIVRDEGSGRSEQWDIMGPLCCLREEYARKPALICSNLGQLNSQEWIPSIKSETFIDTNEGHLSLWRIITETPYYTISNPNVHRSGTTKLLVLPF